MYACVHTHGCMWKCVCRLEVNIECLPQLLSTLFGGVGGGGVQGLSLNMELTDPARLVHMSFVYTSLVLGSQVHTVAPGFFFF